MLIVAYEYVTQSKYIYICPEVCTKFAFSIAHILFSLQFYFNLLLYRPVKRRRDQVAGPFTIKNGFWIHRYWLTGRCREKEKNCSLVAFCYYFKFLQILWLCRRFGSLSSAAVQRSRFINRHNLKLPCSPLRYLVCDYLCEAMLKFKINSNCLHFDQICTWCCCLNGLQTRSLRLVHLCQSCSIPSLGRDWNLIIFTKPPTIYNSSEQINRSLFAKVKLLRFHGIQLTLPRNTKVFAPFSFSHPQMSLFIFLGYSLCLCAFLSLSC